MSSFTIIASEVLRSGLLLIFFTRQLEGHSHKDAESRSGLRRPSEPPIRIFMALQPLLLKTVWWCHQAMWPAYLQSPLGQSLFLVFLPRWKVIRR